MVLGLWLGVGLGLGLGMAEELLVRGEQAPGLAHARRAVEALLEAGVPQNLDQQLDIQAVEESCALRNANAPHRSRACNGGPDSGLVRLLGWPLALIAPRHAHLLDLGGTQAQGQQSFDAGQRRRNPGVDSVLHEPLELLPSESRDEGRGGAGSRATGSLLGALLRRHSSAGGGRVGRAAGSAVRVQLQKLAGRAVRTVVR